MPCPTMAKGIKNKYISKHEVNQFMVLIDFSEVATKITECCIPVS